MYYSQSVQLINPSLFDPRIHLPPDEQHLSDLSRLFIDTITTKHLIYPRRKSHHLKARYLQDLLGWRAQKPLRKSLIGSGVIGCKETWREGAWSMAYWLKPEFKQSGFSKINVEGYKLCKRVAKLKESEWDRSDPILQSLDGWVRLLRIDFDRAKDFLDRSHRRRNSFKYQRKLLSIEKIRDGDTGLSCVDEQGRVYTNVSWLWKQFRPFLSVNGERLVNLDIANSQPLFLAVLLTNKALLKSTIVNKIISMYSVYHNDTHFLNEPIRKDVNTYKRLCESGQFYTNLMAQFNIDNKNSFKRRCFASIFYGRNERTSKYKQAFTWEFPNVAEFIHAAKAENYKTLPLLLQHVEANFIIKTVCKRLTEERPDVPLITIHDSITTTERYAELVRQVILKEFDKLGTAPLIRLEG